VNPLRFFGAMFAIASCGHAAAPPLEGSRFAILCEGTADFVNSAVGAGAERRSPTGPQTFVIDEKQQVVFRALEPRQMFDPVCGTEVGPGKASISPGMITVFSYERTPDDTKIECNLTIDRKIGTAKYEMTMAFDGGGFNSFVWDMKCKPTSIPLFDTNRNKF
jgi:hypothetical protein